MITHPYILLKTSEPLQDAKVLLWIKAVESAGPQGIVVGVELTAHQSPVRYYKRAGKKFMYYVASVARNLNVNESYKIAQAFDKLCPDIDFEIDFSQNPTSHREKATDVVDSIEKTMAIEAAKQYHSAMIQTMMEKGWRFGQRHNPKDRTTPLLIDWDRLPDAYKLSELKRAKGILGVFDNMGLKLKKKD